jgi:hypothetical protein
MVGMDKKEIRTLAEYMELLPPEEQAEINSRVAKIGKRIEAREAKEAKGHSRQE